MNKRSYGMSLFEFLMTVALLSFIIAIIYSDFYDTSDTRKAIINIENLGYASGIPNISGLNKFPLNTFAKF